MFNLHYSSQQDLDALASCHKLCFPHSLSTGLGKRYIKKTLEWFLAADNRFIFQVMDNDLLIGYCGGFISNHIGDGSVSGMMQYAMRQMIVGVVTKPWLLFKKETRSFYPVIKKNIGKKFFTQKKIPASTVNALTDKHVGLVVIGVHPAYRGQGVFEMLMKAFEAETQKRAFHKMSLSVRKDNERAIAAYTKAGWSVAGERGNMLQMRKVLD